MATPSTSALEARQLLDTAARAAGLGLCTLQRQGQRWRVHWNAQMHALHAWPPGRRPPRTLAGWLRHSVHAEDEPWLRDLVRRWLRRTDAPLTLHFRTPATGAQAPRWLSLHLEATGPQQLLAVVREQADPLPALPVASHLLAHISHELRTPLHAILGVTQLMLMADPPSDLARRRQQLEQVQGASRHLLALIDGALDLSTPGTGAARRQPVDLPAVVAQALGLVRAAAAARHVRIEVSTQHGAPPVGEPTRLRQVLVGLLSRAIQGHRAGGTVTLSARSVPLGPQAQAQVVLSVADDGPGLSAEQQARLFHPYADTPEHEAPDSGLNASTMATAKVLTESMGGSLRVRSSPGQGSVFEVWLQQAATPQAQAWSRPAPLASPAPPGLPASASGQRRPLPRLADDGRGRVLYIEDNPINAMILQASVAHRPRITLQVAEDGASGIRLAQSMQPHLVLLDMHLPDTNGHAVLKALHADPQTAHLPCIALSANMLPDDIRRALAAGFVDYWTKPMELPSLLGALDALFGHPGSSASA
ncbi:response regulator [uncultured Aquincola sp.]|uniref:hybrid sensor histidine kinase/response regulator n=1 Tax=uncultured Aquincola sp. TaxID=886556 RepID=UPI0032B11455